MFIGFIYITKILLLLYINNKSVPIGTLLNVKLKILMGYKHHRMGFGHPLAKYRQP